MRLSEQHERPVVREYNKPVLATFVAGLTLWSLGVVLVWLGLVGYQTHIAVCTLRADLVHRNETNHSILKMNVDERTAYFSRLYGPRLGREFAKIPDATITNQIRQQEATIHSLSTAHCDSTLGVFP